MPWVFQVNLPWLLALVVVGWIDRQRGRPFHEVFADAVARVSTWKPLVIREITAIPGPAKGVVRSPRPARTGSPREWAAHNSRQSYRSRVGVHDCSVTDDAFTGPSGKRENTASRIRTAAGCSH